MGWQASVVAELAEIIANDPVNAEYRHLVAHCSDVAASGTPGQFFQLLCPQPAGEQPFLRRPMSIYGTSAAKREVEFLYKVTGAGTRGLHTLKATTSTSWGRSALASRLVRTGAISLQSGAAPALQRSRL
jgi:NAD(P)H-flavin reductase